MSQRSAAHDLDLPALQKTVTEALIATTRSVSELATEDLDFHRSLDPAMAKSLDKQTSRLLELAERLLNNANGHDGPSDQVGHHHPKDRIQLRVGEGETTLEVLDGQWSQVVDVADSLLERADSSLDEYRGVVKKGKPQGETASGNIQAAQLPTTKPALSKSQIQSLTRVQNIMKPQLRFDDPLSNHATGLWKPVLTEKPHGVSSLEDAVRLTGTVDEEGSQHQHYTHPYEQEIASFTYPASMYTHTPPVPPRDFQASTAKWIDTPEALQSMLEDLKQASEIAIDLEHHDYRTYTGITCLMQISTRDNDYIVDTLVPWRRKLQVLNEAFADPSILKVLHGSTMDIIWLQRDLGLYIVGLFDTYHASRTLTYPQLGLAYLLQRFCNFQAQKVFQRADWRVRPLPQELFDYARSDTHFLLYIFDCMRNELIERSTPQDDLLQYVLEGSKQEALQRYDYARADRVTGEGNEGWMKLILQNSVMLNKEQFSVYKALHAWRDSVARTEDESVAYVLPNQSLFSLAKAMPFMPALLYSALPLGTSPIVRSRVNELIAVIDRAKEDGKDGPELNDVLNQAYPLGKRKRGAQDSVAKEEPTKKLKSRADTEADKLKEAKRATLETLQGKGRVEEVRAGTSIFWGASLNGSFAQQEPSRDEAQEVRLALPLPDLTKQASHEEIGEARDPHVPVNPAARDEHVFIKAAERKPIESDDIFTVRQLGGKKRKLDTGPPSKNGEASEPFALDFSGLQDGDDGEDDDDDDDDKGISSSGADDSPMPKSSRRQRKKKKMKEKKMAGQEKAQRQAAEARNELSGLAADNKLTKAQKRAAKRAANAAKEAANGGDGAAGSLSNELNGNLADAAPYDYSTAPSLLNGPLNGPRGKKAGKGKGANGAFNPYQKGNNAPKGLGKKQKEGPGRSGTFAS